MDEKLKKRKLPNRGDKNNRLPKRKPQLLLNRLKFRNNYYYEFKCTYIGCVALEGTPPCEFCGQSHLHSIGIQEPIEVAS
jgi:hypothetical protein